MAALLTASTALADVEINETNFPDYNFRDYLKSQKYGSDGVITDSELANVTILLINNKRISNLKGIENFTNLTTLSCSGNRLTTLDLSKNIKLETLYCGNNQIESINLGEKGSMSLKDVNISENKIRGGAMLKFVKSLKRASGTIIVVNTTSSSEGNVITTGQVARLAIGNSWTVQTTAGKDYAGINNGVTINATYFPDENFRSYLQSQDYGKDGKITSLEIDDIESITVNESSIEDLTGIEHFIGITIFQCSSNKLTSLDLSKNNILAGINCSDNELTSLTLPSTPDLQFLTCNDNKLTSLDVSGVPNLAMFICKNNQLSYLDVSKNTKMISFDCNNNQLSWLLLPEESTSLSFLDCSSNKLTSLAVAQDMPLSSIYLNDNKLAGDNLDGFIRSLRTVSNSSLIFASKEPTEENTMTADQIDALKAKGWTPRFTDNSEYVPVTGLAIDETTFPDEQFRWYLINMTSFGKDKILTDEEIANVKKLSLEQSRISDLTGIGYFTELESLSVTRNNLQSLDLSQNTKLTSLEISLNYIKGKDMDRLISTLPKVSKGYIMVIDNMLDFEGNVCTMKQVSALIDKGWGVYQLNSEGERVSYPGTPDPIEINATYFPDKNFRNWLLAQEFGSDGLLEVKEITSTKKLDVSSLGIASLEGIKLFPFITELSCGDNALEKLDLSSNVLLTYLDCQSNQLSSLDLSQNTALENLYCGWNQLTELDLSQNKSLKEVYCTQNQLKKLDVSQCKALVNLNCQNNHLTTLDLSQNQALGSLSCDGNSITSLLVSPLSSLTDIWCWSNRLRGGAMTRFIDSLPKFTGSESWEGLYIIVDYEISNADGNVCTEEQVKAAKEKGWTVFIVKTDNGSQSFEAYDGSDPVRGDINGDGAINATDLVLLVRTLDGPAKLAKADVNGDGDVDEDDVETLVQLILYGLRVEKAAPLEPVRETEAPL